MNFSSSISKSWQLLIQCLQFFSKNKDLLFFPIITLVLSILTISIILTSSLFEIEKIIPFVKNYPHPVIIILFLLTLYFSFLFMIVYFNTGLIVCAVERLQGKQCSIADGLKLTARHWWPLLQWTIFSATIGFILNVLESSHKTIAEFISILLGFTWAIGTYFVIPIIVFENVGPFQAIKRGFTIFGRGWRLYRALSILFILNLAIIGVIFLIFYGLSYLIPNAWGLFFEISIGIVFIMIILSRTLNSIVNSALFLSFMQNKEVSGFDSNLLKRTFVK